MSLLNAQAELAELILEEQTVTDLVTPAENIAIYTNNVKFALINTLINTYPLLVKLLGKEFFQVAAKEYIQQYPARNSHLNDYGEYFSYFLTHYPPVKNLVYVVEVAEFEWICHSLYFAPNPHLFDFQHLAQLNTDCYDQIRFNLHPASRIVKFHYPILDFIDLCLHETSDEINVNKGGVNLLIIRRDLEIKLVELTEDDFHFLQALSQGQTLANALTQVSPSFDMETKLLGWVKDRTIVGLL